MSRLLCAFAVFALALACTASAEKLLGRAEPIPTDKCATSVITADDERLFLFVLSEDSYVWHKYQKDNGTWSTWRQLSTKQKMGSGPKAVRYINGTLQVFARGTDRKFYATQMVADNQWSDWTTPFGDITFSSPPVPVINAAGSCLVFGVNADTHTVWYAESSPITTGELTFGPMANLGGWATSPPAVIVDAEALTHVFIRGTNRALWHLQETYTKAEGRKWGEWECLGGVLASSPKVPVSLTGVNMVEVYARASDKGLWHRRQNTTKIDSHDTFMNAEAQWYSWTPLGGVLASGPAVALNDDGLGDVFVRATDKSVYYKSQIEDKNGQLDFTVWKTLGGMFSSTPSVIVRADGLLDIFARGVDKAIWHSHQVENNGTRQFSSWHSLGGHTRKYPC